MGMRDVNESHIGDTFHHNVNVNVSPLPGFKPAKPMVCVHKCCGLIIYLFVCLFVCVCVCVYII